MEKPPAPSPPVAFNVAVSFKSQEATLRLALPGEDYSGKPLKALLPQLDVLSTQHISGAYKVVGLSSDGARLDLAKTLRAQGVLPAGIPVTTRTRGWPHARSSGAQCTRFAARPLRAGSSSIPWKTNIYISIMSRRIHVVESPHSTIDYRERISLLVNFGRDAAPDACAIFE